MRILTTLISAFAALLIAGAASADTVKADAAASANSTAPSDTSAKPAAIAKGATERFAASLTATHDAAVAALKMNGFDIKSDEPALITGARPHKIGLVVGSGGEKIKVTLTTDGDAATVANVNTQKTFVGMAGQKNWDAPVIEAMKTSLAAAPTAVTAIAPEAPAASPAIAPAAAVESAQPAASATPNPAPAVTTAPQ